MSKLKLTTKEKAEREFKRYLKNCDNFENVYKSTKIELSKRFGFDAAEGDILWGTAQALAVVQKDYGQMKGVYFSQALYIHNLGKDSLKYQQIYQDLDLKINPYKAKKVQISGVASHSCPSCSKLVGKIFTIKEALSIHPLPCKDCSLKINPLSPTGWCLCSYSPVLE